MHLEIAFWMAFGFVILEASAIFGYCRLSGLVWHSVQRDAHNLRVPLLPAQIAENEEIKEMGLFALIHFSLWMIIFLFSFYFIEGWMSFLYYGPEGSAKFGSLGFWVLNLLIPAFAVIKKAAYPQANMKPVYWLMLCSLFLIIAFSLKPPSVSAKENRAGTELATFSQPITFDLAEDEEKIVELPAGFHYYAKAPRGNVASFDMINATRINPGRLKIKAGDKGASIQVDAVCNISENKHHPEKCVDILNSR